MKQVYKIVLCFLVLCFLFFNVYQSHRYWTDGDEPHYLVVTSSIITDFDLKLDNNYEQKDYLSHHGLTIDGAHVQIDNQGVWRPFHGILSSIVYIPGYIASQNAVGPKLIQLLVFIATIYVVYLVAKEIDNDKSLFYSIILFAAAPVFLTYSTVLYPDIFQALLLLCGVYGIIKYLKYNNSYYYILLASVSFGLSLFVHYKIALNVFLMVCVLGAIGVYNIYKKRISISKIKSHTLPIILATVPFWLLLLLHMIMTYSWYSTLSLSAIQDAGRGSILSRFTGNPFINLSGQLFDYDAGIFWYHTLLPITFLGFGLWAKKHFFSFALVVLSSLPIIVLNAFYDDWTAGFSPASRYLVPYILLFFPAFWFGIRATSTYFVGKVCIAILFVLNSVISIFLFTETGRYGYPSFDGYNIYWREMTHYFDVQFIDTFLSRISFFDATFGTVEVVGSVFFFIIMLVVFGVQIYPRKTSQRTLI